MVTPAGLAQLSLGPLLFLPLPSLGRRTVRLGLSHGCRRDHGVRHNLFHVSLSSLRELHRATSDRQFTWCDGICFVSNPGAGVGNDTDRRQMRAAVASDIGGKKYGRQLEALESLGVRPRRYLLTGILHAFLIGTPLLVGLAYLTAQVTSQIVFMWIHPDFGADYWRLHFHRELSIADQWAYKGTGWLLAKVLVCGIGIALVSYHRGARPKNSPAEVSQSVTSTILWTTLFVLCVHFAFAFIEFELMGAAVP